MKTVQVVLDAGLIEICSAKPIEVNALVKVEESPFGLVIVTDRGVFRLKTDVVQVTEVELMKVTDVQLVPPTVTVAPESKELPVKVMNVFPAPEVGEIEERVGAPVTLMLMTAVVDPPVLVAVMV